MPAEDRGPAGFGGTHRGALHVGQDMGLPVARPVRAEDLRQLQSVGPSVSGRLRGRRPHGLDRRRGHREAEQFDRRAVDGDGGLRDVQVAHGRLNRSMAEQALNGGEVDAHLEQVRGEGVAPMPHPA